MIMERSSVVLPLPSLPTTAAFPSRPEKSTHRGSPPVLFSSRPTGTSSRDEPSHASQMKPRSTVSTGGGSSEPSVSSSAIAARAAGPADASIQGAYARATFPSHWPDLVGVCSGPAWLTTVSWTYVYNSSGVITPSRFWSARPVLSPSITAAVNRGADRLLSRVNCSPSYAYSRAVDAVMTNVPRPASAASTSTGAGDMGEPRWKRPL